MSKQRGFTLIELLVVIAIIGLLSTLAVVSLNNARMKSRDAVRVSDIKQIQTALELYYNDENSYPTALTAGEPITNGTITYMNAVPSNPEPQEDGDCSGDYAYASVDDGASYTLTYCLGGEAGGIDAGTHTAYPGGIQ